LCCEDARKLWSECDMEEFMAWYVDGLLRSINEDVFESGIEMRFWCGNVMEVDEREVRV